MSIAKRSFVSPINTAEVIAKYNEIHKWAKFMADYHEAYDEYRWNKFSSYDKTEYTWNEYNVNTTVNYVWDRHNVISTSRYYWSKYNTTTSTTYYWNTYKVTYGLTAGTTTTMSVTLGGGDLPKGSKPTMTSLTTYTQSVSQFDLDANPNGYVGCWVLESSGDCLTFAEVIGYQGIKDTDMFGKAHVFSVRLWYSDEFKGSSAGRVSATGRNTYPDNGIKGSRWYVYDTSSTSYSKGSTYYGTVNSYSSSTYPNNGKSGSYWYVYSYSTTEYSKGSTQQGAIQSTNRNLYPDNGKSGSYWYTYRGSNTEYSKGSHRGTVNSYESSKYPNNAKSGNYWYTYLSSRVVHFKGETSYPGVSSLQSNTYPANGYHSDGFWYEQSATINHPAWYTQGEWLVDLRSNNPNEYPADGRHSDGFWYRKLE